MPITAVSRARKVHTQPNVGMGCSQVSSGRFDPPEQVGNSPVVPQGKSLGVRIIHCKRNVECDRNYGNDSSELFRLRRRGIDYGRRDGTCVPRR